MELILNYLQLGSNAFALLVAGWIYKAYIKHLNASLHSKNEQIKVLERNINFLKDKNSELEKKTPENIERILNERIKIREEEVLRLSEDRKEHTEELESKTQEIHRLRSEVKKSEDIRRTMTLLELDLEEDDDNEFRLFSSDAEYEIEEMGFIAVDSGQLMITDPCYIDSEWKNTQFEDIRLLKDKETAAIYQFRKDFFNYEEKIEGFHETVNELIASGKLEEIEVENSNKIEFSYAGACYSTLSEKGYGVLPFELGHEGAGVVVRTVLGDGVFPVYAEKYDGKIVRVYFNLI